MSSKKKSTDNKDQIQEKKIKLTDKQERYCYLRAIEGKNQIDAYTQVYNYNPNNRDATYVCASQLDNTPKIALRIQELKATIEKQIVDSVAWNREKSTISLLGSIKILDDAIAKDAEKGIVNPSLIAQKTKAQEVLNKMYGLEKQQVEIFNHEMKEFTLNQLERLEASINNFWAKAQKLNPLWTKKHYILMEGGRTSGKTFGGADIVIYMALTREGQGTILCGREVQKSIKYSSKRTLERRIKEHGLDALFETTDQEIRVKGKDVNIIFIGLKEAARSDTLKGIDNVFLAWIDEAQSISQISIDKLIPTVIRNKDYKLIFTMNRQFESDPIYKELTTVRPHDTLHLTVNYMDNPYLPQSSLEEALLKKETDYSDYLHIWEGQPKTSFKNSLWTKETIEAIQSQLVFDRDNYISVEIALDPATTNDEFSNEYGLIVGGKTKANEGHTIADLSGHYSVEEFCNKAIEAYYQYKCDCMVVEVNQGGEWLKAMLLSIDPTLNIKEVRALASQDKISRAKPIAALYSRGMIKHIGGGFKTLEAQMMRMTDNGFMGADGESPDRADALVWLYIDLFDLKNLETTETYIKSTFFPVYVPAEQDVIRHKSIAYTHIEGQLVSVIGIDIIDINYKGRIVIRDYDLFDKAIFTEKLKEYLSNKVYKEIYIIENTSTIPIIDDFSSMYVGLIGIVDEFYKKKINEKIISAITFMQEQKILVDNLPNKTYNSNYGNLFMKEITSYQPNSEQSYPLLHCLCNIIFREFGLTSE